MDSIHPLTDDVLTVCDLIKNVFLLRYHPKHTHSSLLILPILICETIALYKLVLMDVLLPILFQVSQVLHYMVRTDSLLDQ